MPTFHRGPPPPSGCQARDVRPETQGIIEKERAQQRPTRPSCMSDTSQYWLHADHRQELGCREPADHGAPSDAKMVFQIQRHPLVPVGRAPVVRKEGIKTSDWYGQLVRAVAPRRRSIESKRTSRNRSSPPVVKLCGRDAVMGGRRKRQDWTIDEGQTLQSKFRAGGNGRP